MADSGLGLKEIFPPRRVGTRMEISRKTDYALRILSELIKSDKDVLSVRVVAQKHQIPYSFARSIQHDLTRAGIISSSRGSHGGMSILARPEKTSILDVVEAVQGPVRMASCSGAEDGEPCPFRDECHFNPIWCEAERMLEMFFKSVTLEQVVVEGLHPRIADDVSFELVGMHNKPDTVSSR